MNGLREGTKMTDDTSAAGGADMNAEAMAEGTGRDATGAAEGTRTVAADTRTVAADTRTVAAGTVAAGTVAAGAVAAGTRTVAAGTDESEDTDESDGMDATTAAAIIAQAGGRARGRLRPGHRVTFAVWGVLYTFGYGIVWLAVRGQHPVHGPSPAAFAAAALLALAATLASVEEARSETGVRGLSVIRRRAFQVSALAGYAAMFALEGALYRAGASRPVLVVFEASAPILVIGLLYLVRSVTLTDWPVAGLGLWLVIVAATSGYAGTATVWGIDALAVGPAFLLVAAFAPWLYRS
jgi:hypothetical protein